MAFKFKIHEYKVREVLRKDRRYYFYLESVAHNIREAAISVFLIQNHPGNEGAVSEYTPPKFLASFRVRVYRKLLKAQVANTDPGWMLVEWGAHPGGGHTRVLRYKPLTRGLLIVAARHKV